MPSFLVPPELAAYGLPVGTELGITAELITAMRRGRWQDLAGVAGMAATGVAMGALMQALTHDPRILGVSPVGAVGLVTIVAGLAAPIGITGRAALVAGGTAYALGAQMYGFVGTKP